MITLEEIRSKYPGAASLSDDELIGVTAERYGTTPDIFREAIGYKPPQGPEGGFMASVKQTIGAGIKGAGRAASDFIPGVESDNALTQYGQEVIDANPTAVRSFGDIGRRPGTAVAEATGNAAGSMAGIVGSRALGMGITAAAPMTGPLAPATALLGQAIAWFGPAAMAALPSYGGIRDKQILNDPNNEADWKSKAIAGLGAATVGAIETKFGPQQWALSALTKEGRAALAEKFAETTLAKGIGFGALKGAAVEGAEELAQNPVEQLAGYDDPTTKESLADTAFGGAMGAIGGGVFGGATGGIIGRRGEKGVEPKVDTPADPLLLGNTPDPIVVFPDGTAGRRADLEAYVNGLPEDQQVAARAKLMGMGARDATPEDILKAPDADSAIAAFTASLTGTDLGAMMGQENPLIGASRDMQAQTATDQADLADLAQTEARDLNTLRALAVEDARKQRELDALQATGTGQYGIPIEARPAVEAAATVEAPTAMQLAMQRARAGVIPNQGQPLPMTAPRPVDPTPVPAAPEAPAIQRQPDILPGDISRNDGKPFQTENGARLKQREAGGIDGSEIVAVQNGFVVRPKTTPTDPTAATPGQTAGMQSAASGVPAAVDPAQPINQPLTTENTSAQTPEAQQSPPPGQTPAASAAPVPASIPDPVQPAESGTVPAKAQADPRLIPVSKRAPAQRDDLTDDETTAEFERLYQEDVKADIRRRLGMEPPAKEAKPKASAFRTFLRKYGINPQHASDITGERGVRANNRLPATFRRNGLGLDELALRAVESGYLTQADLESDSDNGGTNKLMEMIQAEIRGERQETTSEAGDSAEAQLESVRRAELEDMATALGIPFDAGIDPMILASMVSRVQRALDASKEPKGSTKADRVRANAVAAAQRIEAKRQKYERELEEFAKASIREQNAFLEVLMDDDGTPVVNRLADQQADDAWNELLGAWEDQNGQTETPAEPPSRQAGTPDGAGAAQRPGDAQEGDSGQQRRSDQSQEEGLKPTRESILADLGPEPKPAIKGSPTEAEFQAYLAWNEREDAAKIAAIGKVGDIAIVKHDRDDRWLMILPDVEGDGKWRTQSFGKDGFTGHEIYGSKEKAIASAASSWFIQRDDGALDRMQDTPEFQRGLYAAELIQRLNRGEIDIREMNRLMAERQAANLALTAPTRADVLRQQERTDNAEALDDRAQIDREAGAQTLTAQTAPEQRRDTTGDIFGGPTPEEARAAKEREDRAKAEKKAAEDAASGQAGMFDEPAEPAQAPASNPDALRAQADLQNALADLADIFGRNTRATIMPEQEQKMLPVLVKVFDAAFRMGYHKFKDAAKFALDQIRKALGDDAANAITIDHLQGAYISMSGGRPQADSKRAVIDVEDKADIESHVAKADNAPKEPSNVPSTNPSVEPDRAKPAAGTAVGTPVSPRPAGTDQGTGQDGGRTQGQGRGRPGDARVPTDSAPADGERGDQLFRGDDEPPRSPVVDARTDFGERSGDSGITGIPPEPVPASEVGAVAVRGDDELRKRGRQLAAGKLPAKPGDLANIRETLPYLLPGQQEDVHKAEQRFAKPDGYGMLFTNGTGTGKTFTGLGVVKRFAMRGKSNTLIIVPDDKIAEDWVASGKALGLDITRLASTKDKGKGIVITTYANMGENDEIANRKWDLIVPDEAHSLMQSADGAVTSYLSNLRAVTHHPDGWVQRFTMQNRDMLAQQKALSDQITANNRLANLDDTMDAMRESLQRENARLEAQLAPISKKLNQARDAVRDEVAAMQGEKRTRLVFLSATPFAYEKTVDWANGYLFDYKDGYPYTETNLAYNQPNPREHFFMTRFGYSMRYNKLTEPDGTKIDRGLMQRQFNGELKKGGALSGRMLDVPADYDRRFVLVDSAIGNKIDEALAWLTEKTKGGRDDEAAGGYSALRSVIEGQFDYLSRRYLLEAIKAQEVVPIIKKHMSMGRKVVVFHDYKKGGAVNPFDLSMSPAAADAEMAGKVAAFNAANADFRASFPELVSGLKGLRSPIEVFNREFPGVMLINGDEKKADLLRRYKSFQSDDTGPQVMLVQSAKNKGWSGHDTTGKHQRVLINLGQPTAPTLAIQQEGRIYRTGQVSNAIMRYLNTGTNWERWTFATTIASRASTAENLGMGELARALKDSFIASFEESDTYQPGHDGEGTGGKERDKAANNAITEYDRAKTYYWATQKKNSKTKAQEGADYFATPEPVGLKMAQWIDVRPGEDALEPSAGHGAIARWLPDTAKRTVVEPSLALRSRLAMVMNPGEDRIIAGTFEDLSVNNKYHGIAMNPPFGGAGKTAVDHLAKAATHLRDGGRISALIPTGPAADKKFDKWFYETGQKPMKPLGQIDYGMGPEDVYKGDTIKAEDDRGTRAFTLGSMTKAGNDVVLYDQGRTIGVTAQSVVGVARTGPRTEDYSPAADLHLIADIKLPQVAFERAGTAVATRIVVIQKRADKDAPIPQQINRDYSDINEINELFDSLENLDIAKRVIPEKAEAAPARPAPARSANDQKTPEAKPTKAAKGGVNAGDIVTIGGKEYTVEVYTTNAGKEKRGVWMDSREEAQKYSQRTFSTSANRGKWFVDEYWFPKGTQPDSKQGGQFARSQPFYSALSTEVAKIPAKAQSGGNWLLNIQGLIKAGKVKADEVEWSGVTDFLKLQGGKVTREQLVQFLDANGVKVTERVLSEADNRVMEPDEIRSDLLTDYQGRDTPWLRAYYEAELDQKPPQDYSRNDLIADLVEAKMEYFEGNPGDYSPTQTSNGAARYGQYQLPGGTNYREVLLTLPTGGPSQVEALSDAELRALILRNDGNAEVDDTSRSDLLAMISNMDMTSADIAKLTGKNTAQYKSSHWDLPNILAHIRLNDRTDADGKRVLFVEEIQSDWGQAGKKKGFTKDTTGWTAKSLAKPGQTFGNWDVFDANGERVTNIVGGSVTDSADAIRKAAEGGAPRAPFVTKTDAWLSLALKRIVKMAVDEGYDRVAFVNGDQSAARYDLSKQVDSLEWLTRPTGAKMVSIAIGSQPVQLIVSEDGKVVAAKGRGLEQADGKMLDEVLGKDAASQIMAGDKGQLSDLKVGGEGMKAFYDKIVPNTLKDVLRKVGGGALETVNFDDGNRFAIKQLGSDWRVIDNEFGTAVAAYQTEADAQEYVRKVSAGLESKGKVLAGTQPGFTITPAMREKAAGGLPMFDRKADLAQLEALLRAVAPGRSETAASVRDMVSPLSDKWSIPITVVQRPDQLPVPAPSDARGLYHNGAIYLVASNLNSRAAVMRTLGHEAIAHHGLREMLGDDGFSSMMRQINMAVKAGNPAMRKISEYVRRTYVDEDGKFELTPEQEADEIAARAVEDGIDPASGEFRPGFGWLKGVFAKVAQFLRDLGITVPMSNTELQGVLVNSMRGLEAGAKLQGQGKMAAAARKEAMARKGAQTDSAEFKAWFKDSKVVDADGKPLQVYHGTKADFTEFRRTSGGEFGPAIYLTDSPREASEYGDGKGWGGPSGTMVMPVYASIKKPYTKGVDAFWKEFGTGGSDAEGVAAAQAAGYDGIIAKRADRYYDNDAREFVDRGGELTHYIAFDPAQVKSAIGNNGDFDPANPDIRFARSVVTGATIPQAWQAPDPSKMDDFLYTMQDKHIDTKRVVTAVRDAIGGIADNLDPYLQEELYHGRAAKATKDFLEQAIRPLMVDMQARGVEMSDFEEYLHNRHAERRNEQVAKVNPNMPDGGSGIKTADARAYLAGLPAAKRTAYQALARRVDQMNRDTRALLVSSGLEKQSTIDAWQAAYGDEYVPLMREEMDNGAMGIGQGFSVRGSSSKRAMGSDKPVANIMANIALQREKAITRAEKRRIGEALYGMVLSAPNPDFWIAVDPALQQSPAQITATAMQLISMGMNPVDAQAIAAEPTQRYIDPRTGQVASRINPALRSADNVLAVRIDGEDKYVFFNARDERAMRMAKALKNLDADQLGTVMGNVAKVTRYFAAVNTQYNPIFGIVNLTRDIQTALLNLQSTGLAGKQAEVMKHVGSALRGIYIDLRDHRAGKTPTSTWAGLFEEFQREGGATGYRDMYANAQERAGAIADELKKVKQGKAMEFGRGVFGWLSDYNESMENAVRLATYKVAKEQGMSSQQAASIAKNLTVNFNRKGQVALQAGAMYAFFNAAVQGTARMAETMFAGGKLSATGKKIMAGGLLLGSMQALLLAAAGYDDEEPPDFVRERSLVLPIGGDKYVSIPMPLGFHVIPNLARIPTEWAMGGFRDTPKRLAQLVGLFADAFNPIGSAGLSLQTLAPTIIDPLAALAENRDWTGKPIAKKDFNSMQPTAGHTRAKDTATPWGRAIAYGVNWVTGGTDYKPGMASPTPDQIDYLIGQATGGVGREVSKLSQVAGSTVSGEELPLYKIPLLGRFVGTTAGQAAESGRFYENLKQIGEHDAELSGLKKDRRMAEYQEYMRDNPEARLVPIADRTYREVSKLIRMKRDALKAGASTERIKMLDQQITARMAAFNQRVRATETRETATQE